MTIGFLKLSGGLFGLGNFEAETEFLPQSDGILFFFSGIAWTLLGKQNAAVNSALANIWSSKTSQSFHPI